MSARARRIFVYVRNAEKSAPKKRLGRLEELLNKPFMIMLFSSLILSGGAKLYADYQENLRSGIARRERMTNLLTEVDARNFELFRIYYALANEKVVTSREATWDLVEPIIRGSDPYVPTRPEFKSTSLTALVNQITANSSLTHKKSIVQADATSNAGSMKIQIRKTVSDRVIEGPFAAFRIWSDVNQRDLESFGQDIAIVERYRVSELVELYCSNTGFSYYSCWEDFRASYAPHDFRVYRFMMGSSGGTFVPPKIAARP